MIAIRKPYVEKVATGTRLCAEIVEDDLVKTLWYEVDDDYAPYLSDRSDGFVIGLLYWAMVYHHDITCEAPMTERLHYQLQQIFCPVLAQHSTRIRAPKIIAPLTSDPLETKGAVGTGCSGGIDSFYVIAEHLNDGRWAAMKLTHLCFFSVGHCFEKHNIPETLKIADAALLRAKTIAERLQLELVTIRSNYNDEYPQILGFVACYLDMACVHVLGKLFGTYFYASGSDMYDIKHAEAIKAWKYDFFSLPNFSTPSLGLYLEGAGLMRWNKTEVIAKLPITYEWLNVCNAELQNCGVSDGKMNRNCGRCYKCQRTLLDMEGLGVLDKYGKVFDLDAYVTSHRRAALRILVKDHLQGSVFSHFAWSKFKHEITFVDWWSQRKSILRLMRKKIRTVFSPNKIPYFKNMRDGIGK